MTQRWTRDARARLVLSLVIEPGDPRVVEALAGRDALTLVTALKSGRLRSLLPEAWFERVLRAERQCLDLIETASAQHLRWITPGHPQWPRRLDDLDHLTAQAGATGAPVGLWVRGEGHLARLVEQSVAIVGARSATSYGIEQAGELAADVADLGHSVISGAAFGIDAAAHRGALATGGITLAVLAGGADVDSPRAHTALLARVIDSGGLIVSEQPPGSEPLRSRFLSRNRLIAALASGTVVVEAARRSGSLNTLHWADRLGRPTMVVPGPVTSAQSGGTHQAVRDGKAVLVTGHLDVMAELGHDVEALLAERARA